MRYYKFSATERKLVMAEAELREPGPGQIRVRVAAASLNYRDVYMMSRFRDVGIDNRIPLSDAVVRSTRLGKERRASGLGTESRRYFFRIGSGPMPRYVCRIDTSHVMH
jgi:NADPH:quinone reductase-like Zn-dependent oxidoreductase